MKKYSLIGLLLISSFASAADTTYLPWINANDMKERIKTEMAEHNKNSKKGTNSGVGTPVEPSRGSGNTEMSTMRTPTYSSAQTTENLNLQLSK